MGLLQRFESRLEDAVSSAFAKAFRAAVQPVELAAALQREVDNKAQVLTRDRHLAPNAFQVELSPTDFERLSPYQDSLSTELLDLLREHAEEQHYVFAGDVKIDFAEADDLMTGRFRIASQAEARVAAPEGRLSDRLKDIAKPKTLKRSTVTLVVNGTRHVVRPPGSVIGRGQEADLRISDPGVSRRHAEVRVSKGKDLPVVTVVDLGSTNGTSVDGRPVTETVVSPGSQITVGNTTIDIEVSESHVE